MNTMMRNMMTMTMMITHMTMKSRLTTGIMDPMPKMKWGIVTMI